MFVTIMWFIYVWTIVSKTGCCVPEQLWKTATPTRKCPDNAAPWGLMCLGKATFLHLLSGFHHHSNGSETIFQIIIMVWWYHIRKGYFSPAMTHFSPAVGNNVRLKINLACPLLNVSVLNTAWNALWWNQVQKMFLLIYMNSLKMSLVTFHLLSLVFFGTS